VKGGKRTRQGQFHRRSIVVLTKRYMLIQIVLRCVGSGLLGSAGLESRQLLCHGSEHVTLSMVFVSGLSVR